MANRRIARLNEQIKREISEILRTEVRDPRIGLPTVTDVEVTPDLWLARVYVRPDPTHEHEGEDFLHGLIAAAPFIRRELGKALKVRRVPELRFQPDRTLEQAIRIERILDEVRPDREDVELDDVAGGNEGGEPGGSESGDAEPDDPVPDDRGEDRP